MTDAPGAWFAPEGGGGGKDTADERGGDAGRKFWIKPLKETDLGVAQAFLDPFLTTNLAL